MRFGILVFPGTWSDTDCHHALGTIIEQDAYYIWHKDTDLSSADCIVIPGGFSYGDYLRCGAIASFSPVMDSVREFASKGGLVIGICNGFQILCEAGLLPGVLMRNQTLEFKCQSVNLKVENVFTPFSLSCKQDQVITIPVSHGEGNYYADQTTLDVLENQGRVVFRYTDFRGAATSESNPNGSSRNIAGIVNKSGNVLGMMPHPERAVESLLGGDDGIHIFESIVTFLESR